VASWLLFYVAHSLRIDSDMLVFTAGPARTALKISQLTAAVPILRISFHLALERETTRLQRAFLTKIPGKKGRKVGDLVSDCRANALPRVQMSSPTYQEEMIARLKVWNVAVQTLHKNLQIQVAEAGFLSADERATAQAILAELALTKFWIGDRGNYPRLAQVKAQSL
jgi:hypothetical protein